MSRPKTLRRAFLGLIYATVCVFISGSHGNAQELRTKLRISNPTLGFTALPLVAARDWGIFSQNGLDVEIIIMSTTVAMAALANGDVGYHAGTGPGNVSATLSGLASRCIWFSSDRIAYWLLARPQFKKLEDLKSKKIGLTGLGGASHVALLMALQKLGLNPKDFTFVNVPAPQILPSMESGFLDAATLNPPVMFFAQRKGFNKLLDIGSMVEYPGGGLTAMVPTIKNKPDEVKRLVKSLQIAKDTIRKSREKTVDLIMGSLKMDRETAAATYEAFVATLSDTGIPTRTGMDNIVSAIKSQGRFVDRKITFEDIADDSLAKEVAKELRYKF